MRVAVTGGAGFLGYHVRTGFRNRDEFEHVRLLDIDKLPPGERDDADLVHCDVRDRQALRDGLQGFDAVVHAAAGLPLWNADDIRTTNVDGTENVLAVCAELGIERVVHVSSTAVYGVPDRHPIHEDDPLRGVGVYGRTKVEAERICERYRRDAGLCVCIIRPKTFLGTARLGVFQILFDWVQSGKRIPMIGRGHNRYQLLEVLDLVDAIALGLTAAPERANDTFNVGAERFGTVREDLGALCDHAGNGARPVGTPAWLVKPTLAVLEKLRLSPLYKWVWATADKDSFVAVDKVRTRLGWQPAFSNAESLIHAYDWYLEHEDEIPSGSGIGHRIRWNQGILGLLKRLS